MAWFFDARVHAFVLMPNHFHLIVTTPVHPMGDVMEFFMRESARELNRKSGRKGHIFGGPYDAPLINSEHYFVHAMKYVYRNPIAAGICDLVEDYPFSTLSGRTGATQLQIPLGFSPFRSVSMGCIETVPIEYLEWLTQGYSSKQIAALKFGLRQRGFFTLPKDPKTRRPVSLATTAFRQGLPIVFDAPLLRKGTA